MFLYMFIIFVNILIVFFFVFFVFFFYFGGASGGPSGGAWGPELCSICAPFVVDLCSASETICAPQKKNCARFR